MKIGMRRWFALFGIAVLTFPALAAAQIVIVRAPHPHPPRPIPIVIPPRPSPEFRVKTVDVNVSVKDQAAKVQLSQVFQNTSSVQTEAQLVFPVPENASITGLTLLVDGKELTGKLMKKEEARRIYEEIVRRRQDPALLEYLGQGLYQTSVFPLPPQGERTVEIRYTQLLKKDNGLVDLVLPLGTFKHGNKPIDSLNVIVRLETSEQIKTIYSPTHQLDIQRPDNNHAVCKATLKNVIGPDDLRLFHGTVSGLVGMNLLSYKPKDNEDGYFLLLASPDIKPTQAPRIERSLIFVCDRSGSMSGQKIEQTKQALKFLIQQLKPGDTFNIVVYDSNVESFRPELQRVDDNTIKAALAFADGLYAGGSTNIDGALQTSLKMLTDTKRPSYVLFMTDGLPTVGEMNEQKIATHAKHANIVNARLFAFGVGYDVNSRLLDRLSSGQRGQSVFVKPNENIEAHVSGLYNKIGSPVLTDLSLSFDFDQASASTAHINRMYPRQLTDLFQGEQLVYVGRYKTAGNAKITVTGSLGSERKTFSFAGDFAKKSVDENLGFVEKLWATRRIGEIIDELDLKGQNKELIDELVHLSMTHGIITPYTSFLADENARLNDRVSMIRRAEGEALDQLSRSDGRSAFEQRSIKKEFRAMISPPASNAPQSEAAAKFLSEASSGRAGKPGFGAGGGNVVIYKDGAGDFKMAESVRNLGQKTFYRKKDVWQDSTVTDEQARKAIRMKQFSREYFDLAAKHGQRLSKYLVFTEPILLNFDDQTYQIYPPDPQK